MNHDCSDDCKHKKWASMDWHEKGESIKQQCLEDRTKGKSIKECCESVKKSLEFLKLWNNVIAFPEENRPRSDIKPQYIAYDLCMSYEITIMVIDHVIGLLKDSHD